MTTPLRSETRIHPLTRFDGRFFAVVTPDGRLVNVILASDLIAARAELALRYSARTCERLTLHPASLTWGSEDPE